MAGGESRLGTASIYMGTSYRCSQLMKAQNHNITWLQTPSQTEIMPQYQSLDSRERGKLRLEIRRVGDRDREVLVCFARGPADALDRLQLCLGARHGAFDEIRLPQVFTD